MLVAAVLVAGTIVVGMRLREVLVDAATVLDDEHGMAAAGRPLGALRDGAAHTTDRLHDVGAVAGHPVRLARHAARDRPWAAFRRRRRATRSRGACDAP